MIGDTWAVVVVTALGERPRRHGELLERIGGISKKMLTQTLRRLEAHGLVAHRRLPGAPPGVEYVKRISRGLIVAGLGLAVAATSAGAVSGGTKQDIATAPYVAWLPNGCTGTLIAPDRVLVAGHCLDGFDTHNFSVLIGKDGNSLIPFGANPLDAAMANGGIPVSGFAVHPRFRESFPFAHRSPQNAIALDDVGLILLARPVTDVAPVRLAGPGDHGAENVGEKASLLGYGLTSSNVLSRPQSLRTGQMTVISAAACKKAYPHAIVASEICGQDLATKKLPLVQAPTLAGSPATVTYKWMWLGKTISNKQAATVVPAMAGRSVGCLSTARNAGGRFDLSTSAATRVVVQR